MSSTIDGTGGCGDDQQRSGLHCSLQLNVPAVLSGGQADGACSGTAAACLHARLCCGLQIAAAVAASRDADQAGGLQLPADGDVIGCRDGDAGGINGIVDDYVGARDEHDV